MYNVEAMQVSNSADYLLEIAAGFLFLYLGVLYYIVKKLSLLYVLHHQKKVSAGLNNLI